MHCNVKGNPRSGKLSVETVAPARAEAWFMDRAAMEAGEAPGDDGGSVEGAPMRPMFWMHLSQEYFLAVETKYDYVLQISQLHCLALSYLARPCSLLSICNWCHFLLPPQSPWRLIILRVEDPR